MLSQASSFCIINAALGLLVPQERSEGRGRRCLPPAWEQLSGKADETPSGAEEADEERTGRWLWALVRQTCTRRRLTLG